MKRFHACLVLITVAVISCQKEKGPPDTTPVSPTQAVVTKPPNADFKISNAISSGNVWEGLRASLKT